MLSELIKETYEGNLKQELSFVDLKEFIKVEKYGSMATELAIDSSDMDILVSGVFAHHNQNFVERTLLISQMHKLH